MIVVAIIGILVAISVPGYIRARRESQSNACQESQAKLEDAVTEWALETKAEETDTPSYSDLVGTTLYVNRTPRCATTRLPIPVPVVAAGFTVCPTSIDGHDPEL